MSQKRERGVCPDCKRGIVLRLDGSVPQHVADPRTKNVAELTKPCPGVDRRGLPLDYQVPANADRSENLREALADIRDHGPCEDESPAMCLAHVKLRAAQALTEDSTDEGDVTG